MYFGSSAFFIQDTICPLKRVLRRNQFTMLDKHVTLHYTYVGDSFPHSMSVFTQDIICSKQFAMLDKHVTLCVGDGFLHLMPLWMIKIKQNLVLFLSTGAGIAQLAECPTEKPAVILTWVRVRDVARDKMLQRSFFLPYISYFAWWWWTLLRAKWQLIQ